MYSSCGHLNLSQDLLILKIKSSYIEQYFLSFQIHKIETDFYNICYV